jgi:predicted transcriptional regulator
MQDQPITGGDLLDVCLREAQTDCIVIGLLFRESWPLSIEELAREFDDRERAEESVRRLAETGLVHRFGDFVFPTRAARRAAHIQIGEV